ncbi:hypothetical protein KSP39_PZI023622 [Platanthera zijinensis]|uniref:glutaredoxin-dependent peroxiredoxin n=2 Tax=Platanthera TaxID=59352 RepID=A0AAP0ATG3_9ASPA
MAASVNNIAAAFSGSRMPGHPTPAFSASPSTPAISVFSSSTTAGGGLTISTSWNPHSTLPHSRRSYLLSAYGPPGPRPSTFRAPPHRRRATISIGCRIPCSTLSYLADGTVRTISSTELARGRKAVILGVPSAFAPSQWWPGKLTAEELVGRAGEMKLRGASVVACVSVNDVFVMRAWGESIGDEGVMMLSDPDAGMARAMGLLADFTGGAEGFGLRSENYCVVADDGRVKALFTEDNDVDFDDVIKAI